jgi:hypothetical protein
MTYIPGVIMVNKCNVTLLHEKVHDLTEEHANMISYASFSLKINKLDQKYYNSVYLSSSVAPIGL